MADKCLFLQSRFVFSPRILFTYYYPITWTFSQASCFRCYIFPLATNYLQINYSSMIKFQPLISQLRVFTIRIRDGIGSEMDWRWLYPCGRSKSKNPNPNLKSDPNPNIIFILFVMSLSDQNPPNPYPICIRPD